MGIGEFFAYGGVPMYLIVACSVAAVALIVERAIRIERARIDLAALLGPAAAFARAGKWAEALRHCDSIDKPAARVAKAGLLRRLRPREEVREALEDAAERELDRLEKRLPLIEVLGKVSPLLGLLGTVTGMVDAFRRIQTAGGGPVDQSVLAGGIWQALLTTVAGLSVAIPVYVVHSILEGRVRAHAEELERVSADVMEMATGAAAGGEGGSR